MDLLVVKALKSRKTIKESIDITNQIWVKKKFNYNLFSLSSLIINMLKLPSSLK